jgi:MATE family multidrug resistance protein
MTTDTVPKPTLSRILTIALPMVMSQASETIMLFVDRLMLSMLGKEYIAASMSGGLSSFVLGSLFIGTIGYVNAIVAQNFGAKRHDHTVTATAQGIYLSFLVYPLVIALIPAMKLLFQAVGHTPLQVELEFTYFRLLALGLVFAFLRNALVGFFLGIGRTRIVMVANWIGMFVNVPLNYVLIFGKLGFPQLGIVGAAIGTIAGSFTIMAILLVAYLRHPIYRENATGGWRFDRGQMSTLLRFGIPAGIEMFLNVFAFNLFIQLMHSISEDVATAVTITFNYDIVAFIPMLGVGFAVTSLVGQQVGAGRPDDAVKATMLSLRIALVYASACMALFVLGAAPLVGFFTTSLGPGEENTIRLARVFLRLASLYTLADATQLVFAGALRGAGDTRWVMVVSAALHWVLAVGAVILIRVTKTDPLLVWIFFISFVMSLGVVMMLRFARGKWRDKSLVKAG